MRNLNVIFATVFAISVVTTIAATTYNLDSKRMIKYQGDLVIDPRGNSKGNVVRIYKSKRCVSKPPKLVQKPKKQQPKKQQPKKRQPKKRQPKKCTYPQQIALPEEYCAISHSGKKPTLMIAYYNGDTLEIGFFHKKNHPNMIIK